MTIFSEYTAADDFMADPQFNELCDRAKRIFLDDKLTHNPVKKFLYWVELQSIVTEIAAMALDYREVYHKENDTEGER